MLTNKVIKSITAQLQEILDLDMKVGDRKKLEQDDSVYRMHVRCFSESVLIVDVFKGLKKITELMIDRQNRRFLQKVVGKKAEADNNSIFASLSREMRQGKFQEIDFGDADDSDEELQEEADEQEAAGAGLATAAKKGLTNLLGNMIGSI